MRIFAVLHYQPGNIGKEFECWNGIFGEPTMTVRLIESLATTEPLAEVFSDSSVLQAMLDFEVALARAEAELKIIPEPAARAIAAAARSSEGYDTGSLACDALRAGTPGIPLVKALRKKVQQQNPAAADFVHWGATSQDVSDTALVLLLQRSAKLLFTDLSRLQKALRSLVVKHKNSVMLGRTLLQAAPPVTFGLKAAGWLGSAHRGCVRIEKAFAEALVLQFGGASGTCAALGNRGIRVGELIAKKLKLGYPDAPWHTHRDRLAALLCACGVLTGSLGKMARDISLLMQSEVGEISEPGGDGRGGSSTMPQKRNPIASAMTLAAGNRVPALVAAFLSQMIQEHERAVGGSQAEWATVAAVIQSTGVAIASMAEAAEELTVNTKRMKQNLEATHGSVFAEKASLLLSREIGREAAHHALEKATDPKRMRGRRLTQALKQTAGIGTQLEKKVLSNLENSEDYLGMACEFTSRLSRSRISRSGK
jgi:3-carboxy-cis,cis-muconate cycloisomerase